MEASPRRTRLQRKQLEVTTKETDRPLPTSATSATGTSTDPVLVEESYHQSGQPSKPWSPPQTLTKLNKADYKLLLRKQELLRRDEISIPKSFHKHTSAVSATLVFSQEEAGTAICIRPDGLLLTCSHCIAETADELDKNKLHWLLFASGQVVSAKCVAWDPTRDLALLQVVAAGSNLKTDAHEFPSVSVAEQPPLLNEPLVCVGHPGSEDLEAVEAGVKTNYDVLHVSTGAYRGIAEGQDVQDNSEIGALKHDCWTYWGHSGAPLLSRRSGQLVGLHSSWDDTTGMRRGVPLEAIQGFLVENGNGEN